MFLLVRYFANNKNFLYKNFCKQLSDIKTPQKIRKAAKRMPPTVNEHCVLLTFSTRYASAASHSLRRTKYYNKEVVKCKYLILWTKSTDNICLSLMRMDFWASNLNLATCLRHPAFSHDITITKTNTICHHGLRLLSTAACGINHIESCLCEFKTITDVLCQYSTLMVRSPCRSYSSLQSFHFLLLWQ